MKLTSHNAPDYPPKWEYTGCNSCNSYNRLFSFLLDVQQIPLYACSSPTEIIGQSLSQTWHLLYKCFLCRSAWPSEFCPASQSHSQHGHAADLAPAHLRGPQPVPSEILVWRIWTDREIRRLSLVTCLWGIQIIIILSTSSPVSFETTSCC